MKKILFSVALLTITLGLMGQGQNYKLFQWKGYTGIVDTNSNEIIEPSYEHLVRMKSHECYLLYGPDDHTLAINYRTGVYDSFDYMNRSNISIDGRRYMLAHQDSQAFLVDCETIVDKIPLAYRYTEIRPMDDLLSALRPDGENKYKVDLLSVENLDSVILTFDGIGNLYPCRNTRTQKTEYILPQADKAQIYDENFKLLSKVSRRFSRDIDIEDYISRRKDLESTASLKQAYEEEFERPKTWIDTSDELLEEGYMLINIIHEKNQKFETIPFFKFKWDKESMQNYKITSLGENSVYVFKNGEQEFGCYIRFITDPKKRKIFFPNKYREIIGLQMIDE